MSKDLYDILGVDKGATADDIKAAYKGKAKENHPDKEGGSHEKMTDIVRAYSVLGKEDARKRYDETGEEGDVGFEVKFQELVNFAFLKIIEENDIERVDLVKELNKYIKFVVVENNKAKKQNEDKLGKFEKVAKRLSAKEDNKIGRILEMNIFEIKRQLTSLDDYLKFLGECLEVINHHSYEFDPTPQEEPRYYVFNG